CIRSATTPGDRSSGVIQKARVPRRSRLRPIALMLYAKLTVGTQCENEAMVECVRAPAKTLHCPINHLYSAAESGGSNITRSASSVLSNETTFLRKVKSSDQMSYSLMT